MKKFYLGNPEENKLAGVCAGLAEYTNMDVTLIRALALCMLLIPGLPIVWIYIIIWLLAPKWSEKPVEVKEDERPS